MRWPEEILQTVTIKRRSVGWNRPSRTLWKRNPIEYGPRNCRRALLTPYSASSQGTLMWSMKWVTEGQKQLRENNWRLRLVFSSPESLLSSTSCHQQSGTPGENLCPENHRCDNISHSGVIPRIRQRGVMGKLCLRYTECSLQRCHLSSCRQAIASVQLFSRWNVNPGTSCEAKSLVPEPEAFALRTLSHSV